MSGWKRRDRSPLGRGLFAGVVVAVGLSLAGSWIGCRQNAPSTDPAKQGGKLAARLAGAWISKDDETVTVFFTGGTNKLVYSYSEKVKLPMRSRLDPPVYTGEVRKHSDTHEIESFGDSSLKLKKQPLGQVLIEFEFISDDEFMAVYKCEWDLPPKISGRFRRAVPRPTTPVPDSSPIAVAKKQVERIEQKLLKVESLQRQAQQERDEMIGKLRDLRVESAADLKKNPRGQRMAENLAKLSAEIDGMGSQLATIDTELLKARSIVRRMEQEQAGITDDEMRHLSEQLREAESKTDAAPRPTTPLDVDAALEAALKGKKSTPREKQ